MTSQRSVGQLTIGEAARLGWRKGVNLTWHVGVGLALGFGAGCVQMGIDWLTGRAPSVDELYGISWGFAWAAVVFRPMRDWFGGGRT